MLDKSRSDFLSVSGSQADIAYEILHAAIIGCELMPGQEVSEAVLAKQFDLGKGAVRLALARLRQQNLVMVAARRGYQVTPVTLRSVRSIFEIRRHLEPAIAVTAVGKVDAEHLWRLNAICAAGYRADDPSSLATFIHAQRQFHSAIAHASGNRQAFSVLADLWNQTVRLMNLKGLLKSRAKDMVRDRGDLIRAFESEDADTVRQLSEADIRRLHDIVIDEILASENTVEATASTPIAAELSVRRQRDGAIGTRPGAMGETGGEIGQDSN